MADYAHAPEAAWRFRARASKARRPVSFAEFRRIREVHLWLRQEDVLLPAVKISGEERRIAWKPAVYGTIHKLLINRVYAGAYAFGRTEC